MLWHLSVELKFAALRTIVYKYFHIYMAKTIVFNEMMKQYDFHDDVVVFLEGL